MQDVNVGLDFSKILQKTKKCSFLRVLHICKIKVLKGPQPFFCLFVLVHLLWILLAYVAKTVRIQLQMISIADWLPCNLPKKQSGLKHTMYFQQTRRWITATSWERHGSAHGLWMQAGKTATTSWAHFHSTSDNTDKNLSCSGGLVGCISFH